MYFASAPIEIIDKHRALEGLTPSRPMQIELGCGARKRNPKALGIDISDYDCVDIVGDAYDVLSRFPDGTVDSITSSHFLEHIADVGLLVKEMARVLTCGGTLEVIVPHFSNPYFYSDPTHKNRFGLYTFSYFAEDALLSRKVPRYLEPPQLRLIDAELRFKAARPFYIRYALKRLFGLVVNCTYYTKEFYEENLSRIVPCYEVRFLLRRLASD
jgi:ubiquinone/menaquinone biosynthesis C-methylase UbiE